MTKFYSILIVSFLLCGSLVSAQSGYMQFNPAVRYSRLVIDANLCHFKANTKDAGFAKYDTDGNLLAESESTPRFDYVPGLVAKAVLAAVDLYRDSVWAKPWFYSIRAYGDKFAADSRSGGSLDDLNACKMYFSLAGLTGSGATFEDAGRNAAYQVAKQNALTGLEDHNDRYSIAQATSEAFSGTDDYAGGWWHKSKYPNEMWCDGQYMGPALLALLLADGYTFADMSAADAWDFLGRQFRMAWSKLWDSDRQLLWHAFTATPSRTQTVGWADQDDSSAHYGVSSEYWGRAAGWYFLALVDVLELMPQECQYYPVLREYANNVAEGLAQRLQLQGAWCQLLAYPVGTVPEGCTKANYLEASASAIFTAAYLKGMRLGLFDTDYSAVAKKAYKGLVENFLTTDSLLINSCASAGLSADRDGSAKYYLEGSDTKKITTYTEGKILGAFVLAAVEYERLYMPEQDGSDTDNGSCNCLQVTMKER